MASELKQWPYQQTFNAIAAATKIEGGGIAISVKKFAEAFGPRAAPAATDTGLVTVGYVTPEWLAKHCVSHTIIAKPSPAWSEAVVTRSQAEELLAAVTSERDYWKSCATKAEIIFESERRMRRVAEERLGQSEAELKQVRADNAAQAARIKEAEAGRDRVRRIFKRNTRLRFEAENRSEILAAEVTALREALIGEQSDRRILEAKLAAAQKELEPFADHAKERAVDAPEWRDTDTVQIVVTIGDLRAARAVLGGKPS